MKTKIAHFKQNIENLISKERLESYGNKKSHFDNLYLVAKITPKIASIEIALRNILDFCMIEKYGRKWLSENETSIKICSEIDNKSNESLVHHQYISRFTLGDVIVLIKENRLQNMIFDCNNLSFKIFCAKNIDFYKRSGKKYDFRNYHKVDILLNLLSTLRNRSYHWENITKMKGKCPRLSTKLQSAIISIEPNKIEIFLDFMLDSINKDLQNEIKNDSV